MTIFKTTSQLLQIILLACLVSCVPDVVRVSFQKTGSQYAKPLITLDVIANQTVLDGVAIAPINAADGGDDFSADGNALTYTCFYDSTIDGSVLSSSTCSTLTGVTFSSSTGEMNWTPDGSQLGNFEFKIMATDGAETGERIFTIVVNSSSTPPVNSAPVLDSIGDQTLNEGIAITTIDAGDGGDDLDSDGDTLTYSCFYDTTVDGSVASTLSCTSLAGLNFSSTSGVINWMPDLSQSGAYEFKIIATDGSLNDTKIFLITVNDTNKTPVLDAISNQTVAENVTITSINANDGGDDFDADGDALTYSCYYDMTVNGAVANTTSCTSLTGLTLSSTTGVLAWKPDYTQSGTYEFKMRASDGSAVGEKIFTITVTNVNRAPSLTTIANQTVNEGVAITTIDADDGGDDLDVDGQAITYTCYYDKTINTSVNTTNSCASLSGVTFSSTTGVMNWTPSFTQSSNYEFKITGSDGVLTSAKFFTITVNNINKAPALDTISNQTVAEGVAISTINAADGGDDFDVDNTAITYTCYFDTTIDTGVAATSACSTLTGLSFTASTGVMSWTPNSSQSGNYEFKIIGSDGSLTGSSIFSIVVTNVNSAPRLASISNQFVTPGNAITTINAGENGADVDSDGETITYNCYYDSAVDGSVNAVSACSSLSGAAFSNTTGILSWTTAVAQAGSYEFKITGSDGLLSDSKIFNINVTTTVPFISKWKTTTANESIFLPLKDGATYNFTVDWGDGSPVSSVSSFSDTNKTHTYAVANTYTVTINGIMSAIWSDTTVTNRQKLIEVVDLGDTKATDLESAFEGCSYLTSFAGGNTSKVTNMRKMFFGLSRIVNFDISTFDTSKVTNMSYMFASFKKTTLDLTVLNTSEVTDMSSMFAYNSTMTSLNLSSFDTRKVTTMEYMFYNDYGLTSIDVSTFDTSNVTNMLGMFEALEGITTLNVTNFNTSKVTSMAYMFHDVRNVTTINVSNFDTSEVTDMTGMFADTRKMTNINVSNFNTSKVTSMGNMFGSATALTSLNLSNFDTSNVTEMGNLFYWTPVLATVNLNNWDISKVTAFYGVYDSSNPSLIVYCNQGGSQGTGSIFGKACN